MNLYLLQELLPPNIQLNFGIAPNLGFALGNYSAFQQVIFNLALNARDAMEEDGGSIDLTAKIVELEVEQDAKDLKLGNYVDVTLSDTGPGIPESDLENIFEPFFCWMCNFN